MTPDDALKIADEALFSSAGSRMTDVHRLILRESAAGKRYEQMEGYSPQHIKNEGKVLWDLLSEALGEKVTKTSFKGALEKRLKSGGMVLKPPISSTYKPQTFTGRDSLVNDLLPKLQGQTRLLWITGISGIGKTALGECLASQAWESDPSFQWIRKKISKDLEPNFAAVTASLLEEMGIKDLDSQERNDSKRLTERLLRKLQTNRYWIQLDGMEELLEKETSEFPNDDWRIFFERCLESPSFSSWLVLTSQALPKSIKLLQQEYSDEGTSRIICLKELPGLSVSERLEFFGKKGIHIHSENEIILTQIGETFKGHPLALKVIAGEIVEDFLEKNSNVEDYWDRYGAEFDQIAQKLEAKRIDPFLYNQELKEQVRERIQKSLQRLSPNALHLLCRSAVYRRSVPQPFWQAMLWDCTSTQQQDAYFQLKNRNLVETEGTIRGQDIICQHDLICSVAYDLLKADTPTWETAERQAAHLWLTAYEPAANASNLETVRGYLEAFDHYCEIKQWHDAYDLIANRLDTPTQEQLHNQLNTWSYYHEQINIYKKIKDKLDKNSNAVILHNLGNAYLSAGDFDQALSYYLQRLRIAEQEEDLQSECTTLQNLGLVYKEVKEYNESIRCSSRGIEIAERIGDFRGKATGLRHLGLVYKSQHEYQLAKKFLEESKAILEYFPDLRSECATLGSLGQVYTAVGDYDCASQVYFSSLQIAREIGDRYQQLVTLKNLGHLQYKLDVYVEAINYYQEALRLAKEIPDRKLEGDTSGHLGLCYSRIGKIDESFVYSQQYLYISRENGDYTDQITALINLGAASYTLEKYSEAMTFFEESLDISRDICDQVLEGIALLNIGAIQFKLGQYTESLTHNQMALAIFQEIGDEANEAATLKNLSKLHQALGEVEVARQYCQQALALATELDIPLKAECEALQFKMQN